MIIHSDKRASQWLVTLAAALIVGALGVLILWLGTEPVSTEETHPTSPTAGEERSLPLCLTDETGPEFPACHWDAATQGNHIGTSFTVPAKEPYGGCDEAYLYPDTPGGRQCGWRRVDSGLADALAEGGEPDATTRDWTRCFVNVGPTTYVRCPDGTVVTT